MISSLDIDVAENIYVAYFMSEEDYSNISGEEVNLGPDQAMVYTGKRDYGQKTLTLAGGKTLEVVRELDDFEYNGAVSYTHLDVYKRQIQVTFEDPNGNIITQIRRIVRNDVNFDRLDYLNDLSRYICSNKPPLQKLMEKYEEVMNRKQLPIWVTYLGAVLARCV